MNIITTNEYLNELEQYKNERAQILLNNMAKVQADNNELLVGHLSSRLVHYGTQMNICQVIELRLTPWRISEPKIYQIKRKVFDNGRVLYWYSVSPEKRFEIIVQHNSDIDNAVAKCIIRQVLNERDNPTRRLIPKELKYQMV